MDNFYTEADATISALRKLAPRSSEEGICNVLESLIFDKDATMVARYLRMLAVEGLLPAYTGSIDWEVLTPGLAKRRDLTTVRALCEHGINFGVRDLHGHAVEARNIPLVDFLVGRGGYVYGEDMVLYAAEDMQMITYIAEKADDPPRVFGCALLHAAGRNDMAAIEILFPLSTDGARRDALVEAVKFCQCFDTVKWFLERGVELRLTGYGLELTCRLLAGSGQLETLEWLSWQVPIEHGAAVQATVAAAKKSKINVLEFLDKRQLLTPKVMREALNGCGPGAPRQRGVRWLAARHLKSCQNQP